MSAKKLYKNCKNGETYDKHKGFTQVWSWMRYIRQKRTNKITNQQRKEIEREMEEE